MPCVRGWPERVSLGPAESDEGFDFLRCAGSFWSRSKVLGSAFSSRPAAGPDLTSGHRCVAGIGADSDEAGTAAAPALLSASKISVS